MLFVGLSSCDISISCLPQMQPLRVALLNLSVETGDASPADGSVMEPMIVAMGAMSLQLSAVCIYFF